MNGPFDSVSEALDDANHEALPGDPIIIWGCRAANDSDTDLFVDYETVTGNELDFAAPNWYAGLVVPDDIVLHTVVEGI